MSIREKVIDTAAQVLAVNQDDLVSAKALTDLATFSSFRIVDIIERLEEQLGVQIDAADLTPGNLHHLDALCELFTQAPATDARVG